MINLVEENQLYFLFIVKMVPGLHQCIKHKCSFLFVGKIIHFVEAGFVEEPVSASTNEAARTPAAQLALELSFFKFTGITNT